MQWNMLLVASANSIDINFLRVTQPGDLPTWTQEFNNDMFPAELPLTPTKDESFPVGFDFETGCSNRLVQDEGSFYPVMPMIHICSTYGVLCSFYLLNTSPSYIDVCSPARPLDPAALSLFKAEQPQQLLSQNQQQQQNPQLQQQQQQPAVAPQPLKTPSKTEMSLPPPIGQSTPALPKVPSMTMRPPAPNLFSLSNNSQPPPLFGAPQIPAASAFQPAAKIAAPLAIQPQIQVQSKAQTQPLATALITVPENWTRTEIRKPELIAKPPVEKISTAQDEQVYSRMIQEELRGFEIELKTAMEKSRSLKINIGTREESAEMRQSIENIDELKKEATETFESLRTDVQSNRLGLTEMFSMVYEARAKLDQSKNETSIFINQNQVQDRTSKRTLDRLIKQVSQCEMQVQTAIQVMNSQWSTYQEAINKKKKSRMHNPSLEGLYQTLTRQQEIIYRQNENMAILKSKLGLRDNYMKQKTCPNMAMDSFSDSMISISLADQVQSENAKLTDKKLKNLRNMLDGRELVTIRPQRPERPGLNSEIIREKKLTTLNNMKRLQSNSNETSHVQTSIKPLQQEQKKSTVGISQTQSIGSINTQRQPSFAAPTSKGKLPFENSSPASLPSFGVSISAQGQPSLVPPLSFGLVSAQSHTSFGISNLPTKGQILPQPQVGFGSPMAPPSALSFGSPASSTPGISTLGTSDARFGRSNIPANTPKVPFSGFGVPATQGLTFGTEPVGDCPPKPSFGLSSAPLVLEEKKREDTASMFASSANQAPRAYINPVAHKTTTESTKPPSTIDNVKVATSATFSMPLSHKVVPREPHKSAEKKHDENKPPAASTETTSYTFKLPGKKDDSSYPVVNVKAANSSALLTNPGDSSKPFSMGINSLSPFDVASKTFEAKTVPVTTTTTSIFGGFGNLPVTTTASSSAFGTAFSGFGSNFGIDSNKYPSSISGFSSNLSSEDSKSSGFSFASLGATINLTTASDVKTTPSLTSLTSAKITPISSFSFSSAIAPTTPTTKSTEITSSTSSA